MSPEVSRFILQVAALVTGGGFVQLTIFLLRRRVELRALDASSSAPLLTSANELITRLEASESRMSDRASAVEATLETERQQFRQELDRAHRENSRLALQVAQLRTDLDIAHRQIEELQARTRAREREERQ